MNIAGNLERSAFLFPDRPVVSEGLSEISYAQLNDRSNRVATALMSLGIKPGDPVGLCAPNSGDWLAFYFGLIKAGAVAVTLSSLLKRDELALSLKESQPKVIYTYEEKIDDLDSLRGSNALEKTIGHGGRGCLQFLYDLFPWRG